VECEGFSQEAFVFRTHDHSPSALAGYVHRQASLVGTQGYFTDVARSDGALIFWSQTSAEAQRNDSGKRAAGGIGWLIARQ